MESVKLTAMFAQMLVRILAPIQIGLGLLFWTYNALNLIQLHMLIGLLIVLALWALAGLGTRAGVHPLLVGGAMIWGVLVVVLGITQMQLLPGQFHWIVQVVHLGFGVVAIALAEVLGRRIRKYVTIERAGQASVGATL
jgi:hypothetical protein